jgi:chemotaxis protein MotB
MSSHEGQPIIIVKKIKKGHGGHHGGAWKVAYADFVTAMMALFIVLWILGQSEQAKQFVSAYFTNPKAFDEALASGVYGDINSNPGNSFSFTFQGKESTTPVNITTPVSEPNGEGSNNGNGKNTEKILMQKTTEKIKKDINSMPEFSKLKEQVTIEVKNDMVVIELLDKQNSTFFELGETGMKPDGRKILSVITNELKCIPNKIVIAGHTDSQPFVGGGTSYSNWELSSDRANSARRIMEENGYDRKKIVEVRGYADRNLKFPDDSTNPMNRRVSIIVLFKNILDD